MVFWPHCPKQGIQFGLPLSSLSFTGLKPVLNRVWYYEPRDLNWDCYNQQSYEATDGETWSFVGSNVPQLNESIEKMKYKMNHVHWTVDMKFKWRYDPHNYYEHNCSNCIERPEKFRTFMVVKPVTLQLLTFINLLLLLCNDSFITGTFEPANDQLPPSVAS